MEKVKLIRGSEERAEEIRKTLEEWGCPTWTILIVAYLDDRGWKVVRTERFGGDFVCPDCLTDADKNIVHPLECATKANEPYKEWVGKMRQKYQYFEP